MVQSSQKPFFLCLHNFWQFFSSSFSFWLTFLLSSCPLSCLALFCYFFSPDKIKERRKTKSSGLWSLPWTCRVIAIVIVSPLRSKQREAEKSNFCVPTMFQNFEITGAVSVCYVSQIPHTPLTFSTVLCFYFMTHARNLVFHDTSWLFYVSPMFQRSFKLHCPLLLPPFVHFGTIFLPSFLHWNHGNQGYFYKY